MFFLKYIIQVLIALLVMRLLLVLSVYGLQYIKQALKNA